MLNKKIKQMSKKNKILIKALYGSLLVIIIIMVILKYPLTENIDYNRYISIVCHAFFIIVCISFLIYIFIVSRRNLRLTNIQERYPKLLFQVIESETLSLLRSKLKQTTLSLRKSMTRLLSSTAMKTFHKLIFRIFLKKKQKNARNY